MCAKRNAEDRLNLLKLLKDGAIFCSQRYPEDAEIIDMEIRKQLGEDIPEIKGKASSATSSQQPSRVNNERAEEAAVVEPPPPKETKETICQKDSATTITTGDSVDIKTREEEQKGSQENHQMQCPAVATQTEVSDNKVVLTSSSASSSSSSHGNVKMQDI